MIYGQYLSMMICAELRVCFCVTMCIMCVYVCYCICTFMCICVCLWYVCVMIMMFKCLYVCMCGSEYGNTFLSADSILLCYLKLR